MPDGFVLLPLIRKTMGLYAMRQGQEPRVPG